MDSDEIYDSVGVCVGVLAIILLIVLISCCNRRRQSPIDPSDLDHDHSSVTIEQGLDEATICSYPKMLYSEAKMQMGDSVSSPACCSICLADFEDDDVMRSVPNCGHFYHQVCVDKWLQIHPTCPICRNSPFDRSKILMASEEV